MIAIVAMGFATAYATEILLKGTVNLDGNQAKNVGTPTDSNDATTKAYVDSGITTNAGDIAALEARIDVLETLTASMSADASNVFFTGVKVRIIDGTGSTVCTGPCNGLGNLIVGYDEPRFSDSDKSGSHNFVVGPKHNYPSYGGAVAGFGNTVSGAFSSVSGGGGNTASGVVSSVSGGSTNEASGDQSSVSGGNLNEASGLRSSVSGGQSRTASGQFDWKAGDLFQDIDFEIPDFIKQPLYAFFNL